MHSTRWKHVAKALVLAGITSIAADCSMPPAEEADLVLHHGKVVTVDEAVPDGEALAVKGGLVLAVGSDEEIDGYIGSNTRVIDLQGQLAVPGLIDSHLHFMGVGEAQLQLDLMDVANWEEIVDMVAAAVAQAAPGTLILGRGWHQEKWDHVPQPNVEGFPLHDGLSAVSPDNPVILTHASGHATFANARAMEMAGITASTPNPPGGRSSTTPREIPWGCSGKRPRDSWPRPGRALPPRIPAGWPVWRRKSSSRKESPPPTTRASDMRPWTSTNPWWTQGSSAFGSM